MGVGFSTNASYALTDREHHLGDKLRHELAVLSTRPYDPHALAEQARLLFYLGRWDGAPAYEEGKQQALAALEISPESVEARFWWAVHEAKLAEETRSLSSLRSLKKIEKVLRDISEKAPEYGHGAADRVLGKIYTEAPSWISIGSHAKAELHLRRALEMFPDYSANRIAYAAFLASQGQVKVAQNYVRNVTDAQKVPDSDKDPFALDSLDWTAALSRIHSAGELIR